MILLLCCGLLCLALQIICWKSFPDSRETSAARKGFPSLKRWAYCWNTTKAETNWSVPVVWKYLWPVDWCNTNFEMFQMPLNGWSTLNALQLLHFGIVLVVEFLREQKQRCLSDVQGETKYCEWKYEHEGTVNYHPLLLHVWLLFFLSYVPCYYLSKAIHAHVPQTLRIE